MLVDLWELAMLKPQQITTINAEIENLEYARKYCSDSGIQKVIAGWIDDEKVKLNSGNNPESLSPNQAHTASKSSWQQKDKTLQVMTCF
jgi:hypothetical protein